MLSIYKYIILILSLFGLSSCVDTTLTHDKGMQDDCSDELPLEFIINMPQEFESRAYIDDYGNERFSNDDIIHILGIFNMEYRTEGGGTTQGVESRYGALRYNGRYWEPVAGSKLRWPAVSTSGTFKAYYISESNGILTGTTATETYSLSDLKETTDPLGAQSKENIVYGAAVELDFYHLCAKLTLTDLEQIPSDYFWFTSSKPNDPESLEPFEFNNAFKISLGEDEESHQPTLNFEFCQMIDTQYDEIFISSPCNINQEVNNDETVTKSAYVTYYLEPGYYDEFQLIYPGGENKTYAYLEYNYNKIPDNIEGSEITKTPPNLLANHPYTLSITKSPGIEIINPLKPDEWDESDNYLEVDVEEFLKAIYNETNYTHNGTQILEQTATGTRLLHNVTFKYFDYRNFEDKDFRPNNMEGSVFDGGYHYIQNLGSPLFRYNYGTIQNLGIKSVKATGISYESDNENDMSRHGSLCMWNQTNATIDNVRVSENVTLNIYVKCIDAGEETHNIGGVVGSNTGTISNISLSGNFNINVSGLSADNPDFSDGKDYPVNASVFIGGLIGQNAAQGSISDISALNGAQSPSFNIINTCKGPLGSYSLGGMCGESTGFINDIILSNINIDSSGSSGVTSYIGGITGQLSVSENTTASLSSCYVNGQVKAGVSNPSGSITSVSYIGGIAGSLLNVPVTNCNVGIRVIATQEAVANVLYATGGAFGRIRRSDDPNVIKDLNIAGNQLTAPNNPTDPEITVTNYVGTFAGLVPYGQSWEVDYSDNDIYLKPFYGITEIGGNLSSEP